MRRGSALVIALVACAAIAVGARPQRNLQQVTVFYDTPAAAGSTSVGLNGNVGLRPDGTVQAAAGGAVTSSNAFSNPLLNILTDGAYKNRPAVASTAYTQIPLVLEQTRFPTLSYGLAEGKGDLLSVSDGAWGNAEFGYNPINNNLGGSVSTGTTNSANIGGSDRTGELGPDRGGSGVEFAGFSNDLTNAADARTDQSAQAIAYPHNIITPQNTMTCTQALLYAVTLTQYDLGAPITSLPREGDTSIIPYCLTLFNFGTLDDFSEFVNNGDFNNSIPIPAGSDNTAIEVGSGNEPGSTFVTPPGFAQPLEGSQAGSGNRSAVSSEQQRQSPRAQPVTVSGQIASALERAPDAVRQLAHTPLFQALIDRASSSAFAEAFDGFNALIAKQIDRTTAALARPLGNLNQAMGRLAQEAVSGAANIGVKGFAAAVETVEPVVAATAAVNGAVSPFAKASKATASNLADESQKKLQATIAQLSARDQEQVEEKVGKRRLRKRLL